MKIKDIEIGKDYALVQRSYSRRNPGRHVPGFETFKPYAKRVRVLEIVEATRYHWDYRNRVNVPKPFKQLKIGFFKKDGKLGELTGTASSSQIISLWSDYVANLKLYDAEVEKIRNEEKKQSERIVRAGQKKVNSVWKIIKPHLPKGTKKEDVIWHSFDRWLGTHYGSEKGIRITLAPLAVDALVKATTQEVKVG